MSSAARPGILIVEDEALLRHLLADVADELGYQVFEAPSVGQALSVLEARPGIRVVFTDVRLANGSSGVELAMEAATRWPEIRLIVASGYGLPDGLPANAVFLAKPFDMRQVRRCIIGGGGN